MTQINILMATTFFPPRVGGIEYHVLNLSKHLASKGHRITVLTSAMKDRQQGLVGELGKNIEIIEIKIHFLPSRPYPSVSSVGFGFRTEERIKKLIEQEKIGLVHVHGHHYPLSWSSINAARDMHVPSILTLHGLYALSPTKLSGRILEELYNLVFFSRMLKLSTSIIGLTPTVTAYAMKYARNIDQKVFTISNGVNIEDFVKAKPLRKLYREKYAIPENAVVFLFRGRFTNVKGVLEFVKAASMFAKKCPQAFFLFVGGGPLLGKMKELLKSLHTCSEIVSWVPYSEIPEIYVASDFYVLPSKSEGLPLTVMEAMVSNLHIVATPVGGIPDLLFNYPNKTYIKGFSPTDIADALENACFRAAPTNTISPQSFENFSWDSITNEIEKVYTYASQKPA